jgi:hypothetical protein
MEHGRAADLIVASQADPDWDLSGVMDFPERVALESGRPVLVVPYAGRYSEIGRNVVIAWKAGRESARAVFEALPILQTADKVHILEVKQRARMLVFSPQIPLLRHRLVGTALSRLSRPQWLPILA